MTEAVLSATFFEVLLQMGGSATLIAFVGAGLILAGMSGLKHMRKRNAAGPGTAAKPITTHAMLDALERTRFDPRAVLDKDDMRLLRCIEAWERRQKKGYRVLVHVPLAAAVAPQNAETETAQTPEMDLLDHVMLDFLVIDKSGAPVLGVDKPGRAVGTEDEARDAALRRIVFDKARLPLISPEAGTKAVEVVAKIDFRLETGLMNRSLSAQPAAQNAAVAQVA